MQTCRCCIFTIVPALIESPLLREGRVSVTIFQPSRGWLGSPDTSAGSLRRQQETCCAKQQWRKNTTVHIIYLLPSCSAHGLPWSKDHQGGRSSAARPCKARSQAAAWVLARRWPCGSSRSCEMTALPVINMPANPPQAALLFGPRARAGGQEAQGRSPSCWSATEEPDRENKGGHRPIGGQGTSPWPAAQPLPHAGADACEQGS